MLNFGCLFKFVGGLFFSLFCVLLVGLRIWDLVIVNNGVLIYVCLMIVVSRFAAGVYLFGITCVHIVDLVFGLVYLFVCYMLVALIVVLFVAFACCWLFYVICLLLCWFGLFRLMTMVVCFSLTLSVLFECLVVGIRFGVICFLFVCVACCWVVLVIACWLYSVWWVGCLVGNTSLNIVFDYFGIRLHCWLFGLLFGLVFVWLLVDWCLLPFK